jgi:very-short-patch-repair endonuclease
MTAKRERTQLLERGYSAKAIKERLASGRLHRVSTGIYAVGRPQLTPDGRLIAAVLACGPTAALSHSSAAGLWGIRPVRSGAIEVSTTSGAQRRRPGIAVHRRSGLTEADITRHRGIPVTTPACTLVDLALRLPPAELEAAINQADVLRLTDPEALRAAIDDLTRPGAAKLRSLLDRRTFTFTRSALERYFFPIARAAGLPKPLTNVYVNGHEVDFYFEDLGLVVETDGLGYHRTPQQQAKDRVRDQDHTVAGPPPLRFTHHQIRYEPSRVTETLQKVADRLRREDERASS